MPKTPTHHKKRHGQHHRRSQRYLKTYLPYMPVLIAVALSLTLSNFQPSRGGTLAYATEIGVSSLLEATNSQRNSNGQQLLRLNSNLSTAAQAKAQDMVSRNYWSHNTPDGQEPWVFVSNAGYQYIKAGENLAYGFLTSNETVNGWMNSPTHRNNLLDGAFSEVGFGFMNANNFNSSGPETVVVAMYGSPKTLAAVNPQSAELSAQPVAQASPIAPVATQTAGKKPVTTDTPVASTNQDGPQPVSRVESMTGSRLPWATFAIGLLSGTAVAVLLVKHSLGLKRLLRNSERFVWKELHNPWFDSILFSIIILAITLSQTVGFII